MKKIYDLMIIGGGVSSCVFVSSLINNGYEGQIAIIENGRNLGGRSSSRKSLKNKGWDLNHGSPNFNIVNNSDKLLNNFLDQLLFRNLIIPDDSHVFDIRNNLGGSPASKNYFYQGNIFRPNTSMSFVLSELIKGGVKKNKIELFLGNLIKDFVFKNNIWTISSINGNEFHGKFLISTSNLILHKRSIEILNRKNLPLRDAIPEGENIIIDKIINLLNNQIPIKRINYLIYTNNSYKFKRFYKNKNLHFLLNYICENKFIIERIIFQKQLSEKIGIVIHTKDCLGNKSFQDDILSNSALIEKFNYIFQNSNLINTLDDYDDISIMRWRASQPCGLAIPKELQVCEDFKIAFCGDWFDFSGFGRIEGSMISALHLSTSIMKYL